MLLDTFYKCPLFLEMVESTSRNLFLKVASVSNIHLQKIKFSKGS